MRFVKIGRDPKIGTKNDVRGSCQAHFAHSKFFAERGYEIRRWVFLPKRVVRFVKIVQKIKIGIKNDVTKANQTSLAGLQEYLHQNI